MNEDIFKYESPHFNDPTWNGWSLCLQERLRTEQLAIINELHEKRNELNLEAAELRKNMDEAVKNGNIQLQNELRNAFNRHLTLFIWYQSEIDTRNECYKNMNEKLLEKFNKLQQGDNIFLPISKVSNNKEKNTMTFAIPCSVIRKALDSNEVFLQINNVFLGACGITKYVALIARKENLSVIIRKSTENVVTEKIQKTNNSYDFEKEDYETKLRLNMAIKAVSTIYDSTFNKSSLTKICIVGLTDRELRALHDAAINSCTYSIKIDDDLRNSLLKFTDLSNKGVRLYKCLLKSDYLTNLSTSICINHKDTKNLFTTFDIEYKDYHYFKYEHI